MGNMVALSTISFIVFGTHTHKYIYILILITNPATKQDVYSYKLNPAVVFTFVFSFTYSQMSDGFM